jgi:hypothetical protein
LIKQDINLGISKEINRRRLYPRTKRFHSEINQLTLESQKRLIVEGYHKIKRFHSEINQLTLESQKRLIVEGYNLTKKISYEINRITLES